MNDALGGDVHDTEDAVSTMASFAAGGPGHDGQITYTIKVLSADVGPGAGPRTVLFRRDSAGESIEISAETSAPNLLAQLPELLEAALAAQRALRPSPRAVSRRPQRSFTLLAEELRRVRWLTQSS